MSGFFFWRALPASAFAAADTKEIN